MVIYFLITHLSKQNTYHISFYSNTKIYNHDVKIRRSFMYRDVINNLLAWYEEGHNGILYVKGAYGVGKTWTVKDFAKAYYNDLKSVDCYKNTAF